MESGQLCTAWTIAIDGLNHDDFRALEALVDPACVFEFVGRSRDEIIDVLKRDRAAGWLRHDILSVSVAGTVLVSTARNLYADGTAFHVGGVIRFNADGKVTYVVASDERVS